MKLPCRSKQVDVPVQIAMDSDVLSFLIGKGLIHATDFKCLDRDSKKIVWKLFLYSTYMQNGIQAQGEKND